MVRTVEFGCGAPSEEKERYATLRSRSGRRNHEVQMYVNYNEKKAADLGTNVMKAKPKEVEMKGSHSQLNHNVNCRKVNVDNTSALFCWNKRSAQGPGGSAK